MAAKTRTTAMRKKTIPQAAGMFLRAVGIAAG
jgi:hypothetical protein